MDKETSPSFWVTSAMSIYYYPPKMLNNSPRYSDYTAKAKNNIQPSKIMKSSPTTSKSIQVSEPPWTLRKQEPWQPPPKKALLIDNLMAHPYNWPFLLSLPMKVNIQGNQGHIYSRSTYQLTSLLQWFHPQYGPTDCLSIHTNCQWLGQCPNYPSMLSHVHCPQIDSPFDADVLTKEYNDLPGNWNLYDTGMAADFNSMIGSVFTLPSHATMQYHTIHFSSQQWSPGQVASAFHILVQQLSQLSC